MADIGAGQLDWYKDAIIYQLHIKSFFDANNDGIGDFAGLTARLDYIQDLGVNTIWLLPFYPSPLRDDGYDISDYTGINPSYGEMADFKAFVDAAHGRGLKVITELVINHTSDQHPWFQRARNAPLGSPDRDWYVWSDDDQKYAGTRIIFTDTEKSNWTWDPVAKQYFWHRFFSHQPDLNFDNPAVLQAVIDAMYFWLELGVDGLRLDAIPYLVEREGTSNENIPETHAVIKALRRALDARFPDRFFLAEANMWPEDVIQYFGEGDECHMSFHFPLMPRMYMAVAREDRHPITDIMRQTPEIRPENQWAIFLRNHDELTLEMVTDRERDYLWTTYAEDKRARINVGIRRRLAPLMGNDRRKIELMNSLLMSMPGTPIMYYGDELGMGDNIYLGDRDGVRTPMQWSPDRSGGFTHADPAKLFLPAIMDAVYGFQAVNVEAQSRISASLLSWTKRLIAVRQSRKAFGRGRLDFIYSKNRSILSYIRSYEAENILCVVNLSSSAQAVELDITAFKGTIPVEMLGRARFPMVGELPYLLTLSPYSFYWFSLEAADAKTDTPAITPDVSQMMPDYVTLIVNDGAEGLVNGRNKQFLDTHILPLFLPTQRWFPEKDQRVQHLDTAGIGVMSDGENRYVLSIITEQHDNAAESHYFLPMSVEWVAHQDLPVPLQPRAFAKARRSAKEGLVIDATALPGFARAFIAAMADGEELDGPAGSFRFMHTPHMPEGGLPAEAELKPVAGEQSNSSVIIPGYGVLKFYRHLTTGVQPEVEIGLQLSKQGGTSVPKVLGYAEMTLPDGQVTTVSVLHAFVENQGDGWTHTLNYLNRVVDKYAVMAADRAADPALHQDYLEFARMLGQRTAEVHRALAADTGNPAFAPEPVQASDLQDWLAMTRDRAHATLEKLGHRPAGDALITQVVEQSNALEDAIAHLFDGAQPAGIKTRCHNDYHLGQVLVVKNDVVIVDFEGEPKKAMEERRKKTSPFIDVAGIVRSFDYAAWTALERGTATYTAKRDFLEKLLFDWRDQTVAAFNTGYWTAYHADQSPVPTALEAALVKLFTVYRAFYEVNYEMENRPAWIHIPLSGIAGLLAPAAVKEPADA